MPKAYLKSARISPRKAGVVASLVRGREVSDALTILEHTPRRSASIISKVIKSASANAEHNHDFKPAGLYVAEISVTPGVRFKRYKKGRGYHGRVDPFQHKTSNISVTVDGEKRQPKPAKANATPKTDAANKPEKKPSTRTRNKGDK